MSRHEPAKEDEMIAVLKPNTTMEQRSHLIDWLKGQNVDVHISEGKEYTVLGLVGNTSNIDVELLQSLSIVSSVKIISEPFKKANRKFHPENTVIKVGDVKIGDGSCVMIAGPSSVESEEQIIEIAKKVKAAGAKILRGSAFKQSGSPYEFQGLKADGIDMLIEAKKETGLPIISEIMSINDLAVFENVDIIQVGARNMQNTELLKELGRIRKPVLIKRGLANNIKELLMSAEHVMAGGNEKVILCERGIRTFETYTKNTLDLSAVPVLHELSHLPVIVDPSRSTGYSKYVEPMSLAAAACGADGLMIEVHEDPMNALSDGASSIDPEQFAGISDKVRMIREVIK